ncbi:MAG: hypothetical protein Kow0097_07150 [Candidatus Bipolaricaulota bacterium]
MYLMNAKAWAACVALAVLGLPSFGEAPVLPQGIIPVPEEPPLAVTLNTDKAVYAPGDALRLTFTLSHDAYVYLYNLTPDGKITLLVPNRYLQDPWFPAGTHTVPTKGWVLRVTEPEGVEYIQLVATETPLSFYEAKGFEKDAFLVFAQPAAFAGTIQGLLGGNWGAVWTAYRVYQPKAYLSVTTVPPGAAVSVDGQAVGPSPVSTVVSPGRIRVQASRAGYETRSVQLTVTDGEEVHLSLTLSPSRPSPRPSWPPAGGAAEIDVEASVGVAVGADSVALDLWLGGLGFGASVRPAPPRPDLTQPGPGGEYPWGPELEAYLALWVPFGRGGLSSSAGCRRRTWRGSRRGLPRPCSRRSSWNLRCGASTGLLLESGSASPATDGGGTSSGTTDEASCSGSCCRSRNLRVRVSKRPGRP